MAMLNNRRVIYRLAGISYKVRPHPFTKAKLTHTTWLTRVFGELQRISLWGETKPSYN